MKRIDKESERQNTYYQDILIEESAQHWKWGETGRYKRKYNIIYDADLGERKEKSIRLSKEL